MMYGFTAWTAHTVKLGRLTSPSPKKDICFPQMSFFWEESCEIDILKRDL